MYWYRDIGGELKKQYGGRVWKLALDGGMTCPNRDGTLGTRGCAFCLGGSGDFAEPYTGDIAAQIERAKAQAARKGATPGYIAYFQSYTNTYAPLEKLRRIFTEAIFHPDILILSVATRPDCLPEETVALLAELGQIKPVWVELGLQTIRPETADYLRRGYPLEVYDDAVRRLKAAGLTVVAHMILGLPGETPEQMAQTAAYIGKSGADGVKFQLLHVMRGTDLAADYEAGKFEAMSLEDYVRALAACVRAIPPEMAVHRLTGECGAADLIAPRWCLRKRDVLNAIRSYFAKNGVVQGSEYQK
ncbi:MAG TPA: TIGR01212 family radical SAM protein [Oscillospiraceae bacterium]|nr:TIGR01212 family radical SAM protein [Oscillospiraceae bacterium]HNW03838.1 TIGR01212 family radical SAM protein [Oscillospiraceae bacterium]HPW00276.1 TIGR01212 family radical SAM protein [Oscillospiraceae bacterium]